jgi:hypothetical protein
LSELLIKNADTLPIFQKNKYKIIRKYLIGIFYPLGEPFLQGGVGWPYRKGELGKSVQKEMITFSDFLPLMCSISILPI